MAVLLIGVCLCIGIALFAQEKKMEERADHLIAFAQEAGDCAFLTDEAYIGLTIGELTERTCYHFNTRIKERDMWMFDVFEHAQVMREKEEIGTLLDSGKNVFFIESAGSSTAAQMEESSGYLLEYVGAYPVEEAASLYRFVR